MSLYLIVVLLCLAGPFLLSFEKNLRLYKRWKYLLPGIFIAMILFGLWDIVFTHMGVWQFNPRYNSGIYFLKLPLEEYLFFICIPYACAFSYYAIEYHFPKYRLNRRSNTGVTVLLVITAVIIALLNLEHIYTVVNFFVLALVLILTYIFASNVLQRYYAIFPILFIPFIIVNGILTGTGIEQEVFSYNSEMITGIRILSMPFEDSFYAFSLLLTSIAITDILERRAIRTKKQ